MQHRLVIVFVFIFLAGAAPGIGQETKPKFKTAGKGWADFEKDQWLNIADEPLGYEAYSRWIEKYYTDLKKVITETGIDKQMTGKK